MNTYGPTESTVMITWVSITREILEQYPNNLPVGLIKPGTTVTIDGEQSGEIIIQGDTVANGYYQNPEMTQKSFIIPEVGERSYKTGDLGHLKENYYSAKDALTSKSNYMDIVLN